jgi:trk system potassium uptake protein TrkH
LNRRFDLHLLGWLLVLVGVFLCVPVAAALVLGESVTPYLGAAGLAVLGGAVAIVLTRTNDRRVRPRDGYLVVTGAWLVASGFGAIPYLLAGVLGPIDAVFEATSGFTTTGSTVISDVTVLPRALLLWRAMTQWLGGMGIILFTIAILPLLGIGGMQLFKAEVPGPVADKVRPRLAATARTLWAIYVGFTAAEWLLLRLAGVSGFEALCHSFTTLATGGFSTRNASIGGFGSPTVEWIITLFMLVAGMNFVLHYRLLTGRVRSVWRDSELRYFLVIVVVAVGLATATLLGPGAPFGEALRTASFQVVSIVTTTGYVTANFEIWPHLAQVLLLALMLVGGMSGSTGGGPKSLRVLLAVRSLRVTVHRFIHPHAVLPVKYQGDVVSDSVLSGVWAFLTAYGLIAAGATALIAGHGYDLLTSTSAALTALGNVGPGIGEVGAYDNFAHFPGLVKLTLSGCMLLGRLEVFTILVLFSRQFWRR